MALETAEERSATGAAPPAVSFATDPAGYRHWRLSIDGGVATLVMDVDEQGGLRDGYALKLNSYDLGVDIELHDAVQRLRFEHPEVGAVVITSAKDRCFSAGANIGMLAQSSHPWKVNFCKFTNETRLEIEDASANSGQTYIAAVNGPAAGGGYELALACAEILMIDDGSSAVSLPELPLLAVLPGTGGLTRLVDKRHVRRDLADVFVTKSEGVTAPTALRLGPGGRRAASQRVRGGRRRTRGGGRIPYGTTRAGAGNPPRFSACRHRRRQDHVRPRQRVAGPAHRRGRDHGAWP